MAQKLGYIYGVLFPSKIKWDPTNGPLSKVQELLNSGLGVHSVGPVGEFLDCCGWTGVPWRIFHKIAMKIPPCLMFFFTRKFRDFI